MATLWQKTLFYLGLVDDEQLENAEGAVVQSEPLSQVRTVDAAGAVARPSRQADQPVRGSRMTGVVAGRRVEPPAVSRQRMSSDPKLAEAGVYVRSGARSEGESAVIDARTFTDAQALADHIRAGVPVVLDLRSTEPAMVRRLVDFSTGLTYALDGRMAKIGQGVILVTPASTVIGVEERQRLEDLGLYQASAD